MLKGIDGRKVIMTDELQATKFTRIYTKRPNNIYFDNVGHRCFEVRSMVASSVNCYKCQEYMGVQSLFIEPIDSKLIGNYRANSENWRIVNLTKDEVLGLRRGMLIEMEKMPGSWDDQPLKNVLLFISLLHNQQDAMYE
jgi:hypothetical protein